MYRLKCCCTIFKLLFKNIFVILSKGLWIHVTAGSCFPKSFSILIVQVSEGIFSVTTPKQTCRKTSNFLVVIDTIWQISLCRMTTELEWRRRWKPDIGAKSWQHLEIDGEVILAKISTGSDHCEFLLSDFTQMWHERIEGANITKRSKVRIQQFTYKYPQKYTGRG